MVKCWKLGGTFIVSLKEHKRATWSHELGHILLNGQGGDLQNHYDEPRNLMERGTRYYDSYHCCRGLKSTYEIRIGRSKTITGPYLDKEGHDMATGGGSVFLGSSGDRIGPGHASFVSDGSGLRMFYHCYSRKLGGVATLGDIPLKWTQGDWPEAGIVTP